MHVVVVVVVVVGASSGEQPTRIAPQSWGQLSNLTGTSIENNTIGAGEVRQPLYQ